mgnify:CR=1 FL=1
MYVMIDNYDSFVHNLAVYLEELGQEVSLIRNDSVDIPSLKRLCLQGELDGIILSPGPKSPRDCGQCLEVLEQMAGLVPILGVCLGHQIIGLCLESPSRKGETPHARQSHPYPDQSKKTVSKAAEAVSSHAVPLSGRQPESLPDCLEVDAKSDDGAIMALSIALFLYTECSFTRKLY